MTDTLTIEKIINELYELKEVKSIHIVEAKKIFFDALKIKNNSPDTILYYKNIFYRIDFLFTKFNIRYTNEIDDYLLIKIIDYSLNTGLSANYINKIISTIKYMIKLLSQIKKINNISFSIDKLKEPEKRLNIIEKDILIKIFDYVKEKDVKINLIISLLLATGLRRKELTLLKINNINMNNNSILVEDSKTKQIRHIFFPNEIKPLLLEYINKYKPNIFLFQKTNSIDPISPRSITDLLTKIKKELKLEKLSAHQFRHTFGTLIYEASKDIELTRQLLGHTNYTMTKRYVHHSIDKLKKQYEQHNPFQSVLSK